MLKIIPWILTIVLYTPLFYNLYRNRWDALDYTHAYFILPVALFITWSKRHEIKKILHTAYSLQLTAFSPSLILLTLSLLMFVFGWRWNYLIIQTFSLIPLLFSISIFLYGKNFAKILAFPILYLFLLVPIPIGILDSITLPMRYATSVASTAILTAMRYDVIREGLLINMGDHEIFMGAPCSGFRSLITMISLGLIYIYYTKGKFAKNITLFFSIIPLALIGNLIRIIALCLITFYFGEEAGQGFFHNFSGAVIFFIIVLGLMGLEKLLAGRLRST